MAAVSLAAVAVAGAGLIALSGAVSAQAPDPFVADGDPCCGHPDTWSEVALGVAWSLGLTVIDAVLIAAAVALLWWSATGSWPRRRRLSLIPLSGLLIAVVVFAAALIPKLGEGRDLPDCDSFVFQDADWRAADQDRRLAAAWGIAECGTFDDASRQTVEERLGRPSTEGFLGEQYYLGYDGLDLILEGDRVVQADAGA
jgi:hypothetical protein